MKIKLLFILVFIYGFVKAQDYPVLDLDTNGTPVVIFTENQAQQLDSMLSELSVCGKYKELIELQNKESIIFTNSDSICTRMLDEKDSIIVCNAPYGIRQKKGENLADFLAMNHEDGVCLLFGLSYTLGHCCAFDPLFPWIENCVNGADAEARYQLLLRQSIVHLDQAITNLEKDA